MPDKKVLKITDDVHWIGVLNPTTKARFWDVYLAKIRQVTDPSLIQYIVLDHTEPDHSGTLKNLLEIAPQATVIGSGNAIRYLKDQLGRGFRRCFPVLFRSYHETIQPVYDPGHSAHPFIGH